jgi:hypothetical protein
MAAHKARDEGDIMLAEALEVTRFEVYEGYRYSGVRSSRRHQGVAEALRSLPARQGPRPLARVLRIPLPLHR